MKDALNDALIELSLKNLSFSYKKGKETIQNLSIDIEKGSFTTLLGPSGCGKTTLLKLISGFLEPEDGSLELSGVNLKGMSVEKRKIGMVFQDYALFPHMTVKNNIAYGLKIKKASDKALDIEKKIKEVSENLEITELLDRYPGELSGGQQQRIALARALVLDPKILLMDEPLSSLDTKLREKVRTELRAIQKKLGITTIYVTHDQTEAFSLSDKIAVMNGGKILQYGTPRELFFKPKDRFTADFAGGANFIEDLGECFVVRPQWFSLNKSEGEPDISGKVVSADFLGDLSRFIIETSTIRGKSVKMQITADLPTLETNYLETGSLISLNITHSWKIQG